MISSKFLSFLAILATGAVATNPPNRDWIVEIRTGKGTDYQPLSQMVPIPQGQLIDDTNCSIHVAGESGGVKQNVNPVMTIAGGVPACEVGSRLTGDVYGFGRFSINFLPNNETCDTVTDSCRPLLMFEGEGHPMWRMDGSCEYTYVPSNPPYDLYECGFIKNN